MDSISIPVAKNIILPGVTATIFSCGYKFFEEETKNGVKNVTCVRGFRQMEVIIEDSEICDKVTKQIRFKRLFDHNQMCGRPLQRGQQTSMVIILIALTNLKFSL